MTTILITGANRGIGLEFVRQYLEAGADVIACCRQPDDASALKKLAQAHPGKLTIHRLDVADPKSIAAMKKTLGGKPIDIVINNAGVGGPDPQTAEAIDYDEWLNTFRVNSMAPLIVAQALHENLKGAKEKKLVTITSGLGSIEGTTGGGYYGYRASKAAVNSVMHGLAQDWAKDGLCVGIFHPGWVRTDMGGKAAPLSVQESVGDLRKRIAELNAKTSGKFIAHTGETIPW